MSKDHDLKDEEEKFLKVLQEFMAADLASLIMMYYEPWDYYIQEQWPGIWS